MNYFQPYALSFDETIVAAWDSQIADLETMPEAAALVCRDPAVQLRASGHGEGDAHGAPVRGFRSPLDEVNLTKAAIRELSRRAGLPTWDEPASACLSSRIPYHSEVTSEKLRTIERAERAVRELGFRVCRVRHHDDLARVEIGADELPRALDPDLTARIVAAVQALGYRQVTIDPRGYRMGSLNEGVVLRPA